MGTTEAVARFAGLLRSLKKRSGRSYEDLSRRALASRSALHRYCSGQVVPPDVETVTRIADACGADAREKRELIAAWLAASQERQAVPETPAPPPAEAARPVPPPRSPPDPPIVPAPSRRPVLAAAAAFCAVAIASSSSAPAVPARAGPSAIPGEIWTSHPKKVDPRLFGVTVNSDTGLMPTFKVGSVRFWDSGTRWASLERRRGEYDWTVLDRQIEAAGRNGLDKLFVLGGTPAWAAPEAPTTAYPDGSRTSPPDDPRDWDRFVTALAERYRGRIDAYELWVMGNDRRFFTGTPEQLVDMTRRAAQAIRRIDGKATVLCPGMGRLWEPSGQRLLQRFARLGGYRYCDAASVKLHQRDAADPPETMLKPLRNVDLIMHAAGVHLHLWSTGTTHELALQGSLDEAKAARYAMRYYLTGLVGRELYLRRMYFYNWGSTRIPIVLQEAGTAPTKAALAVERLQGWLAGASVRACGHGIPAGLPQNAWQCAFTLPGKGGAVIRWTDTGRAVTTAPPGSSGLERMDGTAEPLRAGDPVTVSEDPVLIKHA
ncbi:hypothetical protein GCM10023085_40420 [Actinomadura viridis]|uniref:Transcriptional regulator with XRE-family HTH domain n=1 Tax=Actinomadura viridis TaxID=58110 RepID=A0A931DU13_9ACTN|nr:helix-turn-helix domain-containing protein [Actinomadura viridis]MBG6092678.1 transcriptional regulator with XRE-family HTH domain [Actinomadura viridis]